MCFRELYLDGNDLGCEGAVELIKLCADFAEAETFQREEEARRKAEEEALAAQKGRVIDSWYNYMNSTWT